MRVEDAHHASGAVVDGEPAPSRSSRSAASAGMLRPAACRSAASAAEHPASSPSARPARSVDDGQRHAGEDALEHGLPPGRRVQVPGVRAERGGDQPGVVGADRVVQQRHARPPRCGSSGRAAQHGPLLGGVAVPVERLGRRRVPGRQRGEQQRPGRLVGGPAGPVGQRPPAAAAGRRRRTAAVIAAGSAATRRSAASSQRGSGTPRSAARSRSGVMRSPLRAGGRGPPPRRRAGRPVRPGNPGPAAPDGRAGSCRPRLGAAARSPGRPRPGRGAQPRPGPRRSARRALRAAPRHASAWIGSGGHRGERRLHLGPGGARSAERATASSTSWTCSASANDGRGSAPVATASMKSRIWWVKECS